MTDPKASAKKIGVPGAFNAIDAPWSPHIARDVNGQEIRLAKLDGAFDWHFHADADEAFFVIKGGFEMQFRDGAEEWSEFLNEGDLIVVPAGREHRPNAAAECWVMMIAKADERNTGNIDSDKTKRDLPRL